MIQELLHTIQTGKSFQAVHIHFGEGQKEYRYVQVRKTKHQLFVHEEFTTTDVEQLITKMNKNSPVVVAFTGQGILSKKVAKETNYQSKVLFNANLDDFYWYEYEQEETVFAAIARKKLIDSEINTLEKHKVAVVSMSIGIFIIAAIHPFLDQDHIQVNEYEVRFKEQQLNDFIKKEEGQLASYSIGEDRITSNSILGFSTILHYLYPVPAITFDMSMFTARKNEFLYRRAFNILGVTMLAFFLVSLLCSFLLLQYYQKEQQTLQVALGAQNVAYTKLLSLEEDRENKAAILKESGLNDTNFLSFYLHKIGEGIPKDMNLSTITIFPPTHKIKKEQRIHFNTDRIEIHGTVASYTAFVNWVKELKKQHWIRNIEIIDFQRENKVHQFSIKITLQFDV